MRNMEISKQLKTDIDTNQVSLITAIRNHHVLVQKCSADPENAELQKQVQDAQQKIVVIGLEQKGLIDRLRQKFAEYQKTLKTEETKNGIEEKRLNFANAFNRNRKQNITSRSVNSVAPASDDSGEHLSGHSSPEPDGNPVNPHDITQARFLRYFGLVTHEVFKQMQSRRVERKRRSTNNSNYWYGRNGSDFGGKRQKRGGYMASSVSPPNTRQSSRNKNKGERISPPPKNGVDATATAAAAAAAAAAVKKALVPFPAIPNLPSGLTIERVSPNRSSPDPKVCIACKQPGTNLSVCESCFNGFHIGCHNRPLTQTPRHCPRCMSNKEIRTVGALNVPSGMSVSYVSTTDVSEKLEEKKALQDKYKTLTAELNQLKVRHAQLAISLKNQKSHREELLSTQQTTQEKISKLLTFVNSMKSGSVVVNTQAVSQTS